MEDEFDKIVIQSSVESARAELTVNGGIGGALVDVGKSFDMRVSLRS